MNLSLPTAIAISSQGMVAIAESDGRRIKFWKSLIDSNGALPDVVVGRSNFVTCDFLSGGSANITNNGVTLIFWDLAKKFFHSEEKEFHIDHTSLIGSKAFYFGVK